MANRLLLKISAISYKNLIKPLLFLIDPHQVHEHMTDFGERIGTNSVLRTVTTKILSGNCPQLEQTINGIYFPRPVGLSAGFDYDAKLTQVTPALGFGFHTIGTITRQKYNGNPRPMLGRLPKSRSLMVNKGFKNQGIEQIIKKLEPLNFAIPIGISIGRSNVPHLKNHEECIADIVSAFILAEGSAAKHAYYELNISCPNLLTKISFYEPDKLNTLLKQIDILDLQKPLFIKMPIELDDEKTHELLHLIASHKVQGVIFGNLQKNRKDPSLNPDEVAKFSVGNFSGKPTEKRSNELIALTFRNFPGRFTIIGTGGIFTAQDAYKKIKLGANVVQLITGMIFNGPQLIGEINEQLVDLLAQDGFTHISQAVGSESRK